MSPLEREVPPAGEELHLPGPSYQPILLTVGITTAIIGITFHVALVVLGTLLAIVVIVRWIADTRRDVDQLPLEHH